MYFTTNFCEACAIAIDAGIDVTVEEIYAAVTLAVFLNSAIDTSIEAEYELCDLEDDLTGGPFVLEDVDRHDCDSVCYIANNRIKRIFKDEISSEVENNHTYCDSKNKAKWNRSGKAARRLTNRLATA